MPHPLFAAFIVVMPFLAFAAPGTAQTQDYAQHLTMMVPVTQAQREVSVVVRSGLASNATLPDALKLVRTDMLAGVDVGPDNLRALADRWDGLAAQRYVRYLKSNVAAAPASDIAYYATVAVSTGRVWTLPDAIAAMHQLDPATEPSERKRAYIAMLYPHAWAGNALALDAVIDLNGEGRLFGALSEETRIRILERDAANGDGRGAMRMALNLLDQGPVSAADQALAIDYLQLAAATDNFPIKVTATNLLGVLDSSAVPTQ